MAKEKQPLLSLEAHGTIADTLTYQRSKGQNIARSKPRLPYFLTLPSQYQRWLYEDYAYLWRQQSAATQKAYRAAGVRFHLTGFQYWMKYQLTNLPDIAAMWHLDVPTGATTPDSSRNENTGTIIGASPATGLIDGCLSFDGVNDQVTTLPDSSYEIVDAVSLECLVYLDKNSSANFNQFLGKKDTYALIRHPLNGTGIRFTIWDSGGVARNSSTINIAWNTWTHIMGIWSPSYLAGMVKLYLDAVDAGWGFTANDIISRPTVPCNIGALKEWFGGLIDNPTLYTRVLDDAERQRHAARRYPPQ